MPPDRLSIIVFSGAFDRVHYALAMASAAAAVNKPATLFFTMGALNGLVATGPTGAPGWHELGPAEDGRSAAARDAALCRDGIGGFDELLGACIELGVGFMVCEMGMRAQGLAPERLRQDIAVTPGGIVSFLASASRHGAMLFI